MIYSFYIIYQKDKSKLNIFYYQIIINILLIILIYLVYKMYITFKEINNINGLLQLHYLIWLYIALYLNGYIYFNN